MSRAILVDINAVAHETGKSPIHGPSVLMGDRDNKPKLDKKISSSVMCWYRDLCQGGEMHTGNAFI